jgi:hypothetical protein
MSERPFAPGFRLSTRDVLTLIVGAVVALAVASVDLWIGLAIAFVVAHFFLFCNVLRISRPPELVWAAFFAVLAITATAGILPWPLVFAFSAALTLILAAREARKPSYHGMAWQFINPRLPQWWAAPPSDEP